MVKVGLQLKAHLENLDEFAPEGEDFRWYLKLKCMNCASETPEFVYLSLLESHPLKGGRGHASLVLKCKMCSRENSIDIIQSTISKYTSDDSPNFKTIVGFDCRGVEPTSFSPRVGWVAKGQTGTVFNEVDLSENEWADYDEKVKDSVGVFELNHKFVKI